MKVFANVFFAAVAVCAIATAAQAGYLIEVDTDGADDAVLTFSPDFSFGGDTSTASQSAASTAFGMTGGDSIFGGNGSAVDTYVFTYTPDSQADNLVIPAGTDLGDGNTATGEIGGAAGPYDVYATWPFTTNVSGGDTTFTIDTAGDSVVTVIDQNNGGAGSGHAWIHLGTIDYTSGSITVTQESGAATFVSMRSAGVLFENAIPEPSTLVLAGLGLIAVIATRRK